MHQKKASSSKRAKFEEKLEKLAAESKEDRIMLKELCQNIKLLCEQVVNK